MAQKFDCPRTENQLREIQDKLYQHSKEARDAGDHPAFKGLLEIMSAEVTIITAIHNIKSNHGSETPGVDSKTMRNDYLHKPFSWLVNVHPTYLLRFKMPECALNIPNNPAVGALQVIFAHSFGIYTRGLTAMIALDVMDCRNNSCFG